MANPYTSPTLTGYNSSPPSDDGSETASNAVKWATHIDKIGDPVKLYAQSISTNASAAFGKMFGNNVSTAAATFTLDTSYQGKLVVATASITVNLVAAATASTNFTAMVVNLGGGGVTVTIDGDGSETINGSTTLALTNNEWAILVCDGSNWRALVYNTGGGMELLSAQTPSGATLVNFDNLLTSSYDEYVLVISGLTVNTDQSHLFLQFGTGGTPTYQTTSYLYSNARSGSGATPSAAATSGDATDENNSNGLYLTVEASSVASLGNNAGETFSGEIKLFSPSSTSVHKLARWNNVYHTTSGAITQISGGGAWSSTTAVTSVRLSAGGTVTMSGNVALYGVNKS